MRYLAKAGLEAMRNHYNLDFNLIFFSDKLKVPLTDALDLYSHSQITESFHCGELRHPVPSVTRK